VCRLSCHLDGHCYTKRPKTRGAVSKSLRIVWVTNNFSPYTSGVAQSLSALLPALQELGHEVTIITLDFASGSLQQDPSWVVRVPSMARFDYHGNRMAIPWFPDAYVKKFVALYNPDIIHSHHPFLLGASALKAAQSRNVP